MRVIIQRVTKAAVEINGKKIAEIDQGLLVFLGIEHIDNQSDIDWLVNKICNLRIFDDKNHIMNLSVLNIQADILVVSQFTLHASTRKGNRPSYIRSAKPETAIPLYENFCKTLENKLQKPIKTGTFGADMQVTLINDGPVTIWMDSKNKE